MAFANDDGYFLLVEKVVPKNSAEAHLHQSVDALQPAAKQFIPRGKVKIYKLFFVIN